MKRLHFFLILFTFTCLATGCATQNKPAAGQQPAAPTTAGESSDAPMELTDKEEALLEDEFEDWEEDAPSYVVADPIEPFNRAMFVFNDKLYVWILRPLALGYRKIAPQPVRTGVGNFFHNLTAPIRFVNCILQGKGQAAAAEFASFTLNTVYGVLGFGDVTKGYPELNPDPEDLGQTLGRYNIGDGFYIVWPFLGPSTFRDTVGVIGDGFLDPINYVEPMETSFAVKGYKTVNRLSFRIEDIDDLNQASFDPYQAARDFYLQSRQTKIKK
jgi:phospholipid-binding lipoprotein MlaA